MISEEKRAISVSFESAVTAACETAQINRCSTEVKRRPITSLCVDLNNGDNDTQLQQQMCYIDLSHDISSSTPLNNDDLHVKELTAERHLQAQQQQQQQIDCDVKTSEIENNCQNDNDEQCIAPAEFFQNDDPKRQCDTSSLHDTNGKSSRDFNRSTNIEVFSDKNGEEKPSSSQPIDCTIETSPSSLLIASSLSAAVTALKPTTGVDKDAAMVTPCNSSTGVRETTQLYSVSIPSEVSSSSSSNIAAPHPSQHPVTIDAALIRETGTAVVRRRRASDSTSRLASSKTAGRLKRSQTEDADAGSSRKTGDDVVDEEDEDETMAATDSDSDEGNVVNIMMQY